MKEQNGALLVELEHRGRPVYLNPADIAGVASADVTGKTKISLRSGSVVLVDGAPAAVKGEMDRQRGITNFEAPPLRVGPRAPARDPELGQLLRQLGRKLVEIGELLVWFRWAEEVDFGGVDPKDLERIERQSDELVDAMERAELEQPAPEPEEQPRTPRRFNRNFRSLSDEQHRELCERYRAGESRTAIAAAFGISSSSVYNYAKLYIEKNSGSNEQSS